MCVLSLCDISVCIYVCVISVCMCIYICVVSVYVCVCLCVYVCCLCISSLCVCVCVHLRHRKAGCGNVSHGWGWDLSGAIRPLHAPPHRPPPTPGLHLLRILGQVSFYKPRVGVIEPGSADAAQSPGSMAPEPCPLWGCWGWFLGEGCWPWISP